MKGRRLSQPGGWLYKFHYAIMPTFTGTSPRRKSWTKIIKVADTNHLDMSRCLQQSPWQTRLYRSNRI